MWHVLFFIVCCMLIELLVIGIECHYLKLFSQPPLVAEGNITAVQEHGRGYFVYVDNIPYNVKADPFSQRTFGIRDDVDLESYGNMLQGKIGFWARVEYVPLAGIENPVLRLYVSNAGEYVDPEAAQSDHVAMHTRWLLVYSALFAACLLALGFTLKCHSIERASAQNGQGNVVGIQRR